MSTEKELQNLLNIPITITLSGKEFKVSTPTIKDLSEAQQVTKELKKNQSKKPSNWAAKFQSLLSRKAFWFLMILMIWKQRDMQEKWQEMFKRSEKNLDCKNKTRLNFSFFPTTN